MIPGVGEAINAGLGLALEGHNDRRQYFQQKKLMGLQMKGQKEMSEFNQKLALDMWEKTNYAAQRAQMEKAGLNVGLMYGSAGQGGTTQTPGGNVTGGTAAAQSGEIGMGMQLGLQRAMQEAQIELTKAQTEKTKVEAEKTAGVDTTKTGQEVKNLEVQSVILQHEEKIKEIAAKVQEGTEEEQIEAIKNQNDKAAAEARSAAVKAGVDQATQIEQIKQIKTASTEQLIRIEAAKAGIINIKTQTESTRKGIEEMAKRIQNMTVQQMLDWEKWSQKEKELWLQQQQQELNKQGIEFQTGTSAEAARWTQIITTVLNTIR